MDGLIDGSMDRPVEESEQHLIDDRINMLCGQIQAHEKTILRTVKYSEIPQIVNEIRQKQNEIERLYLSREGSN